MDGSFFRLRRLVCEFFHGSTRALEGFCSERIRVRGSGLESLGVWLRFCDVVRCEIMIVLIGCTATFVMLNASVGISQAVANIPQREAPIQSSLQLRQLYLLRAR